MSKEDLLRLINDYVENNSKVPFLEHIDYFKNQDGKIDKTSIATNWANLSKESYIKTFVKAHITMTGANQVNQKAHGGASQCPWKYQFNSSAEIMPCLKHTRDSGIVNIDGSINREILESMMIKSFEYDSDRKCFFLRKSTIIEHLKMWKIRDENEDVKISFLMPSWETVALNEWHDFFLNFTDHWEIKKGYTSEFNNEICDDKFEQTVTADTFLQFYFNGKKLYDRVLSGELPKQKPY